jgi:hypothetical protein
MMEEYDYHKNKRVDKTYISPRFTNGNELLGIPEYNIRVVSKIIDSKESQLFAKVKNELVIRITEGGRQELKASIHEDTRGISVLTFQKFTKETGVPHKYSFSFIGEEILKLKKFLLALKDLPIVSKEKLQVSDLELSEIILNQSQIRKLIIGNQDLFLDIVKSDITKSDIVALGYRKQQLGIFEKLLNDPNYFINYKNSYKIDKDELVWQYFFESNTWIFGYGLNYIFTTNIEEKKLEQVVKGFDFNSSGKRVDALMKTRGIVSALCFIEIKRHDTSLIYNSKPYRSDCWRISDELSGAIAQLQKTVQKSIRTLQTKIEIKDNLGNPTGEELYLYNPKSYIVVGSLKEFNTDLGINEEKYSSFEIFRNSLKQPEIITFDELYERAKYIVRDAE